MSSNLRTEELAFLARLTNAEVSRLRALICTRSEQASKADLASSQERLVEELGRLSARLMVVEEVIARQLLSQEQKAVEKLPSTEDLAQSTLEIDDFHHDGNFHDIETTETGTRFAWSAGRSFSVVLHAERASGFKFLQIFFVAIAKPSYIKSAQIRINDRVLRHRVSRVKDMFCLEATLQKPTRGRVEVKLSVPSVHPLSVPGSDQTDWRDGGIAVARVALSSISNTPLLKRLIG